METVTIIIPTYNEYRPHLQQAIESARAQVGCHVQVVISTVSDDKNLRWLEKQDVIIASLPKDMHPGRGSKGIYAQLNNAIKHITGEWVYVISSNDISMPDKAISEIRICTAQGKKVCYSDFHLINSHGRIIGARKFYPFNPSIIKGKGNFINDAAMVSRDVFDKYMPFLDYGNYGHWDLWLRIYQGEGDVFAYTGKATWQYRQTENSMHLNQDQGEKNKRELDKYRMLHDRGLN